MENIASLQGFRSFAFFLLRRGGGIWPYGLSLRLKTSTSGSGIGFSVYRSEDALSGSYITRKNPRRPLERNIILMVRLLAQQGGGLNRTCRAKGCGYT